MKRMVQKFRYALVVASIICVGSIFLIVSQATYAQALPSLPTEKIWKLTANGEKADLKIDKSPAADGWITGTAHWFWKGWQRSVTPQRYSDIGMNLHGKLLFFRKTQLYLTTNQGQK